jgi:hypothetical protein
LSLAAGNGPDDQKGLLPGRDFVGQWGIRRFMGQILLAGEEPQEWPALLRDMVSNGASKHGIASLERVKNRTLRGRALNFELHLTVDARQRPQMCR